MKENIQEKANLQNHPSFESKYKPQKPSIKVDYKIIYSSRTNNQNGKKAEGKKIFKDKMVNRISDLDKSYQTNIHSRLKSVEGSSRQYESGKFVQSQYCPNDSRKLGQSRNAYSKGKVTDSYQRYQQSKSVQKMIKQQTLKKIAPSCFESQHRLQKSKITQKSCETICPFKLSVSKQSKISNRSVLPSYSQQGIKDIIQYEHAGKYKQERVTPKCTNACNGNIVKDKFRAFNQIHDFDFRKRVNTLSNEVRLTKGLR